VRPPANHVPPTRAGCSLRLRGAVGDVLSVDHLGRELGKVRAVADVVDSGAQSRMALRAARTTDSVVELGENTVATTVVVRWDWK
jgi:hypothetical protein